MTLHHLILNLFHNLHFPIYENGDKGLKTDHFCKRLSLVIGQAICPVRAMKEYLDILPQTRTGPCSFIPMGDDLPDSALQVNLELGML